MNKEEIKAMIKDCVYSEDGITYMSDKQCNYYIDIIEQLQQQNKKYKEEIDKAIEWIRDWTDDKNDWFYEDSKPSELLEILKGVE